MNKNYDVGIIGAGVAGAFAALRLAEKHRDVKTVLIELGRKPMKRRRQIEGWFGCFPTGDGKIYTGDLDKVLNIVDGRRAKAVNRWFMKHLNEVNPAKLTKSKAPTASLQKKFKDVGFDIDVHDYYQWKPESIHALSRLIAEHIEDAKNITFSFDNEVHSLLKQRGQFIIHTNDEGEFTCKKVILCVGRSGWRWVNRLYRNLGILARDDTALYGITVEISAQYMKEFNKSHCTLTSDDLIMGPVSWDGSIIQEDHADLTISAFRSNEDRWKSDKACFSLIKKQHFKDEGCKQTDRVGKLAFLLSGDRVGREKIRSLVKNNSQLSLIPEYFWLPKTIENLNELIPALISRGYFHYPNILPLSSEIKIGTNLETEIDGLFVAGESAGIIGLAAAGITGGVAAESVVK